MTPGLSDYIDRLDQIQDIWFRTDRQTKDFIKSQSQKTGHQGKISPYLNHILTELETHGYTITHPHTPEQLEEIRARINHIEVKNGL